jgi:wolfamin
MVSAAATYVRGELPLVQRVLVLADPERGRLEQIGFVQRSVLYPWATAVLLYTWLLEYLARHGSALFMTVN